MEFFFSFQNDIFRDSCAISFHVSRYGVFSSVQPCQVNFLSNATKCIAHRNWVRMVVLVWMHTESSCWVIGRGVEDSREKVQLGDNNNKYESESEWSEQCLKPKNFHNSVMGERMYPCERGNRSIARNESQGTPTWIGISIIIMIMSNK